MKIRHPEKVNKPFNPIKKKPDWIRSKLVNSKEFFLTKTIVNNNNLVTVCQEANCPNITECWSKRHATFMIMGDTCTRACLGGSAPIQSCVGIGSSNSEAGKHAAGTLKAPIPTRWPMTPLGSGITLGGL